MKDYSLKASYQIPTKFRHAMLKTPRGQKSLFDLNRMKTLKDRKGWLYKYTVGVNINSTNIEFKDADGNIIDPGGHGHTQMRSLKKNRVLIEPEKRKSKTVRIDYGIMIDITTNKTDRMREFTDNEIINIVGIHERNHIKINSDRTKEIRSYEVGSTFEETLFFAHEKQMLKELEARIEYSLLYQNIEKTAPLESWIQNYKNYFQSAYYIKNAKKIPDIAVKFPTFYEYKVLYRETLDARGKKFESKFMELKKVEKKKEFFEEINNSCNDNSDSSNALINQAYQDVLAKLIADFTPDKFKKNNPRTTSPYSRLPDKVWEEYNKIYDDKKSFKESMYDAVLL